MRSSTDYIWYGKESRNYRPIFTGFLIGCNGSKTVGALIGDFAQQVEAPYEQVQTECLAILRKLIERGFLLC